MNSKKHYAKFNTMRNEIFQSSLDEQELLGNVHDLIICLSEWQNTCKHHEALVLLNNAIEQIDTSCMHALDGLYRSAFTSLRLSLEMIAGAVYFSANNLEFKEWLNGGRDLNWSSIMDKDNGVLSTRFSNAYFPECSPDSARFMEKTKNLYRSLSEMVHGNNYTWQHNDPTLKKNQELIEKYKQHINELHKTANYQLSVRFLKELSPESINGIETHIRDNLESIEPIRKIIGGAL